VNLDELRSIQSAERESDALQHLRDGFYRDAGEYVQELREQRRGAAEDAADPYGDGAVRQLTDEIETAKAVTEAIWEARIGKILRVAGLSATDMSASAEGLTPEEAALFERVVDAIETNRETIQGALEGNESAPPPDRPTTGTDDPGTSGTGSEQSRATPSDDSGRGSVPTPTESGDPAVVSGASSDASDTGGTAGSNGSDTATVDDSSDESTLEGGDRVRVRITKDVGTIAGVDGREYHLAADDVAELPDANARPLIERDAARILD
jgi:DNA replication factor GINS